MAEPTKEEKVKKHRCVSCHKLFPETEIEFAPDPYQEEINGDNRKVWECEACRFESAMAI